MGWVRGQTEQKRKEKQRKDLPGLGCSGIRARRPRVGRDASCPGGELRPRGGKGTRSLTPAANPLGDRRATAAQSLPVIRKGWK